MKYYYVITVCESERFVEYHMKMIRLGEFVVLHCGRKDVCWVAVEISCYVTNWLLRYLYMR